MLWLLFSLVELKGQSLYLNWQKPGLPYYEAFLSDVFHFDQPGHVHDGKYLIVVAYTNTIWISDANTGEQLCLQTALGEEINKPIVAKLQDGLWYFFVTSIDGFLYKFRVGDAIASSIVTITPLQSIDLRRPSSLACATDDMLTLAPEIQLKSLSNPSFNVTADLIFVGTHHGCNSTTTNMIYALDAANLSEVWVFNSNADYQANYWTGLTVDYGTNTVFGTSINQSGSNQNTVWSINSNNGQLNWAVPISSVFSKPVLATTAINGLSHLYACSVTNGLTAIDPQNGNIDWTTSVSGISGFNVQRTMVIGSGVFSGYIFIVGNNGIVYAVADFLTFADLQWQKSIPDAKFMTSPIFLEPFQKVYIGSDNGAILQLSALNGNIEEGFLYFNNTNPVTNAVDAFSDPILYKKSTLIYDIIGSVGHSTIGCCSIKSYKAPFTSYNFVINCNTTWENPATWSTGMVPDANTLVSFSLPAGCTLSINSHAVCKALRIEKPPFFGGGTVMVNPNFSLHIGQ